MLIDVVKAEAVAAMVDGGLRSGVNGVGAAATFGRNALSIKLRHVWTAEGWPTAPVSHEVV